MYRYLGISTALPTVRKAGPINKCFSSVSTSSCTSTNSHTSKQGQKWWWNNKTQTLFNLYLFIITKGFLQNTWHKLTLLLKYGPYMELFLFQILISMIEFKFYLWKYALKKVIHFVEIQLEVEIEEKHLSAVASFPHCPIVLWLCLVEKPTVNCKVWKKVRINSHWRAASNDLMK